MRKKHVAARITTALFLLPGLLGVLQPLQPVQAAATGQEGTVSWGTIKLPPAEHGHLTFLPEPPELEMQSPAPAPFHHPMRVHRFLSRGPEGIRQGIRRRFASLPITLWPAARVLKGQRRRCHPAGPTSRGDKFVTYNNYAALSTDYGSTWSYIDPETKFPNFSDNQDVIYDPSQDITIWMIVDTPTYDALADPPGSAEGDGNTVHLAVFDGSANLEDGDFTDYKLRPEDTPGVCSGAVDEDWFDDPQLALSSNFLYITSNVRTKPSDLPKCTTTIRILLEDLPTGSVNPEFYGDTAMYDFAPAQGGTDTFYFATHLDTDTLRVYTWPESATASGVGVTDIEHDQFLAGGEGDYDCEPFGTGVNPCANEDDRVRSGWVRGDSHWLGFMWDVPQGTDVQGTFDWPRIRYVILDASSGTPALDPVEDSYIYSSEYAWFLPAAAVNHRGHVGGVAAFAGGTSSPVYPGCAAWVYDDYTAGTLADAVGSQSIVVTAAAGNATGDGWGDYYRTRPSGGNSNQWLGACYAVEGAGIAPRYVRFGRERDGDTLVDVAGITRGAYILPLHDTQHYTYPTLNTGPVEIVSFISTDIIASEQLGWKVGGVVKSVSETMGLPAGHLSATYYFPWYAQSVWVDTELRIGNVGNTDTSVLVTIGDASYGPFVVAAHRTFRPKFPGEVDGPVKVEGLPGIPLVVSERMAWKVAGNVTTVADMIGLPAHRLTDYYVFPWYVQNTAADTELRIANVDVANSSVSVKIGPHSARPLSGPSQ